MEAASATKDVAKRMQALTAQASDSANAAAALHKKIDFQVPPSASKRGASGACEHPYRCSRATPGEPPCRHSCRTAKGAGCTGHSARGLISE